MKTQPLTACKRHNPAAGATQGNIAYTRTVTCKAMTTVQTINDSAKYRRQNANAS
jgi:hypothetical protein